MTDQPTPHERYDTYHKRYIKALRDRGEGAQAEAMNLVASAFQTAAALHNHPLCPNRMTAEELVSLVVDATLRVKEQHRKERQDQTYRISGISRA